MIKAITAGLIFLFTLAVYQPAFAGPAEDRQAFVAYFESRFPDIPFAEYANGIYAIDQDARNQWIEIEEFPPYEFAVEQGESLWQEKFADGKGYSDCFNSSEADVRQNYPQVDGLTGEVITLDMAINLCREEHGQESYEEGKRFYYSKRCQLNLSCADCHVASAGQYVRADHLSASLGHPTHFPVYRSKLGSMLSLHQRVAGCIRDVRAKPFDLQSTEYRNLEYFLTYMSNGLEANGPGARK